ncbi:hypothetical protein [Salegentibacter mishustinae]|uniref:hypothetical protein n=1 Tax=Salegentibacter mishustinae TaxID=270918 RepID=UPI0024914A29|nr:hypothetical protein [Salegentibacter mishustinae]
MTEYNLDKLALYKILKDKGITHLFHANTVSTSVTFLESKNLLSRQYIEENKLHQTPQYSDKADKDFGIFDDIFLDFIDIHKEWNRYNKYGPFLFVFSIEILKSDQIKTLRITKKNPVNWKYSEPEEEWYYSDLKEFEDNYKKGNRLKDIGSMLILKDIDGKLSLRPHLDKMILDNPNLFVNYKNEKKYLANLIGSKLRDIVEENDFTDIERGLRHKHKLWKCTCWLNYNSMLLYDIKKLKLLYHLNPNK